MPISFDDANIVVVANAYDYKSAADRTVKLNDALEMFRSLGAKSVREIDLRNGQTDLSSELDEVHLIWFTGGNTFMLRRYLADSGLDRIMRKRIKAGLIYGGESAGACVVSPSLTGIELADDPNVVDNPLWNGLGYTDSVILPHADEPAFAGTIAQIADIVSARGDTFTRIGGQGLLILDLE